VDKKPGDKVAGATINAEGALTLRATAVGADTALAQIVRLVEEAQGSKAPVQRLADRISGIFVPVVALIALGTFLGWWLVAGDASSWPRPAAPSPRSWNRGPETWRTEGRPPSSPAGTGRCAACWRSPTPSRATPPPRSPSWAPWGSTS